MITIFTLWIECHYRKDWDDIYLGTVIVDVIGIITIGTVIN